MEVEEPARPLQIGQRLGVGGHNALELGAGGERKPKRIEELGIVALKDAEEVGDVAAEIVDDLRSRTSCPAQEDASHAHEGLGIGGVIDRIDPGHDALGEVAFSAEPWGHRGDGFHGR